MREATKLTETEAGLEYMKREIELEIFTLVGWK